MCGQLRNRFCSYLSKGLCFLLLISLLGCQGVVKEIIHGVEVTDPYRWLEDGNSRKTRQWIKQQNEYTQAVIGSLPGRGVIRQRITELMRYDQIRWPFERNGRYFFYKRMTDQEQFVICMRKGLNGEDEVLIDPHTMGPDHSTSLTIWDISKDGSLVAYGVRKGGEDESTIKLYDVDRRRTLPDHLKKAKHYYGCISLKPDNSGFYYVGYKSRDVWVYYHTMGTGPSSDVELFGKACRPDKCSAEVGLSEDGRFLLINIGHGTRTAETKVEVYYQNVAENGPVVPIVNDIEARFEGRIADNYLFLQTNWNAPNGRILRVDLTNPAREYWQEIVPECEEVIKRFSLAGNKLLVAYMHNARSQVKIFEPDGTYVRDIGLPAICSARAYGRWDSNEAFLVFSSFHLPPVTYRYDMEKDTKDVWWQAKVPIDSDMFKVEQVWYESKDGTKVPMFIVHAKGLKPDGQNPTLLTGYGGFNHSLTPSFSSQAALWIKYGGIYALPNLRGGGEFGEEWHKAGMLDNKQNVFDDFFAAAEWLIAKGYTSPAKMAISGSSNGGLLVVAALTQRPELFQAVVCRYPLTDMVRYHKFLSARYWASEYGSSNNPEQFKNLYAYSPYHNVEQGTKYPAVLLVTGNLDTRVDPLHARKMTALLQSATGSDKPVLLKHDTKAGHSGVRPMSKQIEETTDNLSFLFWQLGLNFFEQNSLSALSSSRQ